MGRRHSLGVQPPPLPAAATPAFDDDDLYEVTDVCPTCSVTTRYGHVTGHFRLKTYTRFTNPTPI